ncbi:MAG: beta-N-acetylhexosaminidase [Anaerolineales bacterium]
MIGRRDVLRGLILGWLGVALPRLAANSGRVDAFLNQMTLRQKIGQLFLFSVPGTSLTADMRGLITEASAGGLALFRYNIGSPETLTTLTNDLQRAALANGIPAPLFLAVDQEGGRVARLQSAPFGEFPNPMALGAANNPELTAQIGAALAVEMRACGLNMNLAPVLDVNSQPLNPVINVRAFGDDPARVAEHGAAFVRGSQAAGVIATGKHFPGHGATLEDSHFTLPVVSHSAADLRANMAPFEAGIRDEMGAMMTAHVLYEALDSTPATFSAPIMTDLLRGEFGFEGVLLSDALTMGAVAEARDNPVYVLRDALLAGVDMLAYGALPDGRAPSVATQWEQYELVVRLVESGLLPESRIDEAARRVLAIKERFGLLDWSPLDAANTLQRLPTADHRALIAQVARESVTLLRDDAGLLPLADLAAPPTLIFPAEVPAAARVLAAGWPGMRALAYHRDNANMGAIMAEVGDGVIICCSLDVTSSPATVALLNALPLDRSILVALRSPYDILAAPSAQTYLMTYGTSEPALLALRAVLRGEIPARGQSPVALM